VNLFFSESVWWMWNPLSFSLSKNTNNQSASTPLLLQSFSLLPYFSSDKVWARVLPLKSFSFLVAAGKLGASAEPSLSAEHSSTSCKLNFSSQFLEFHPCLSSNSSQIYSVDLHSSSLGSVRLWCPLVRSFLLY